MAFKKAPKYKNYPVAMFGWRAGEKSTAFNEVPGVPLSPAVLENEIINGVKLEMLELDMENSDGTSRCITSGAKLYI